MLFTVAHLTSSRVPVSKISIHEPSQVEEFRKFIILQRSFFAFLHFLLLHKRTTSFSFHPKNYASRDQQHDAGWLAVFVSQMLFSVFTADNNFSFSPLTTAKNNSTDHKTRIFLLSHLLCLRHLEMLEHKNRVFVPCFMSRCSEKPKKSLCKDIYSGRLRELRRGLLV